MAVSDWRYGICPHCGYINFYVKPSKFPICKCCDYEDPIIITNDERHNLVVSIKASINEQKSNEESASTLAITNLQFASGKPMTAEQICHGNQLNDGDQFTTDSK